MRRTDTTYPLRRAAPLGYPLTLGILLASACGIQEEPRRFSSEGERLTVRMVAANITSGRFQSYDPGHGARILEGIDPDVVLIQEFNVGENSEAELDAWVESTFGEDADYVRGDAHGIPNGVISKLPILESGVWHDPHVSNRDFPYARIDVPGERELWAVSVHFLTSGGGERTAEAREVVDYAREQVPEDDYLVVGGDFNTGSRGERALDVLGDVVDVSGPYPVDQHGTEGTNAGRDDPYDAVYAEADLGALEVPVELGTTEFPTGAVIDTRVYEPISDIAPARPGDSGAPFMQHMAVVRDFAFPTESGPGADAGQPPRVDAGAPDAAPIPDAALPDAGLPDAEPPGGEARLVINEVLANEPGSDVGEEFVEIVNVGDGEADLDGWTLSDGSSVRHHFSGVRLAPAEAWVVFAEASSTGALSLANGGDEVYLRDADGFIVDDVDYGGHLAADDGVSMNREDEGRADSGFVLHWELAGADASPGTRADGSAF